MPSFYFPRSKTVLDVRISPLYAVSCSLNCALSCQVNNRLQTAVTIPYSLAPASKHRHAASVVLKKILICEPRAVFSAVRIYALSPNTKPVAVLTFLLLFMPTFIITVRGFCHGLKMSYSLLSSSGQVINAMDKSAEQPSPFNCSNVETPISPQVANR